MLLVKTEFIGFNTKDIQRGTLICAKHRTWGNWRAGMVTNASQDLIRVQYLPSIQNVQNHYLIPVSEVVTGEWEIRYSPDNLKNIFLYPLEEEKGDS